MDGDKIWSIYEKIEKIEEEIENKNYRNFYEDGDFNKIIGTIREATSVINMDVFFETNPDKKYWLGIADTKKFLLHEYYGVDFKMLYEIAVELLKDIKLHISEITDKGLAKTK